MLKDQDDAMDYSHESRDREQRLQQKLNQVEDDDEEVDIMDYQR